MLKIQLSYNINDYPYGLEIDKNGLSFKEESVTIPYMTVCIVALAEDKKKAVLIADKMLTTSGLLPSQVDGNANKIFKFNDNFSVLWAGGVADALSILEEAKKNIGSKRTVKELAEHINNKHLEYLHGIIERSAIIGRGLKDIHTFYFDKSLNLDQNVRGQIDQALATHNLNSNTSFIVCGKDNDGIYKIYSLGSNPRNIPQLIIEDYCVIGSGEIYARASILGSEKIYKSSLSIDNVKKIILEAKKKSESDPGVGNKEDIIILE